MTKTEALQQRKKLLRLIEDEARAEVFARLVRFDNRYTGNLDFTDYAEMQIEKKDEMRRLVFGTDDLVKLGEMWKII